MSLFTGTEHKIRDELCAFTKNLARRPERYGIPPEQIAQALKGLQEQHGREPEPSSRHATSNPKRL